MLKALLRLRLELLKSWLTGSAGRKKPLSKWAVLGFGLLLLYGLSAFGFLFWHSFSSLALPFQQAGLGWLYFALAAFMAFALMFVGSVFAAKAQLYEARDNDLLLSMPIKPGLILLSRMLMLWLMAFVLALVTAIPALLAWKSVLPMSGAGLAAFLTIFLLLLPLLAQAASALLAWLLSLVSSRLGGKSYVTLLFSLLFWGAYMYAAFRMNSLLAALAADPNSVSGLGAVAPLYWAGLACAGGDAAALLKITAMALSVFALVYLALAKSFVKTATARRGQAKKRYVARSERAKSPAAALFRRELSRFLSSAGYMLNCGFGLFIAVAGGIFLLIKGGELLSSPAYPLVAPVAPALSVMLLCFMASSAPVSAPSVSLEGKSLWLCRSLPVPSAELLKAKLRLHDLVCLPPMVFCSLCLLALLRPEPLMSLGLLLVPAVFSHLVGLLGLAENLRHPNFDWLNETQAVKNGMAVLFTMLISWALLLLPVGAALLLPALSMGALALGYGLLLSLLCLLLHRWLMTRGSRMFESL